MFDCLQMLYPGVRIATRAGLLGLLIAVAGCGGSEFQPMSGSVTIDGKPLQKGVITFYPTESGTTVGGEVIDGAFALEKESGASPGKYRVEIIAFRPTGKTEFDVDQNARVDIEVQYLPARYNTQSTLECEVVSGKKNDFEFKLDSK